MQCDRAIIVHARFLNQLAILSKSDAKLRRIVEDKARLLACCPDLKKYRTKLKNEQAKRFFGILLHIDIGKRSRRMFALVWGSRLSAGGHLEVILPLALSKKRDKINYSNLAPYIAIADSIVDEFDRGLLHQFRRWQIDRSKIIETDLPYWLFVAT